MIKARQVRGPSGRQHKEARSYLAMARKSIARAQYWLDRDDSDQAVHSMQEAAGWAQLAADSVKR